MTYSSRRGFLKLGLLAGVASALPGILRAEGARVYAPARTAWRTFELRTTIVPPAGQGATQVWLPLPDLATDWQRTRDDRWSGNAMKTEIVTDPASGARMLRASFAADEAAPTLTLISTVETRDRVIDWSANTPAQEDPAVLRAALAPSRMKPLDGVVLKTARSITAGATTDVEKVRAIYDWIVATCHREPSVPGCGPGDIAAVLTQTGYAGKCADLNGLFVGLARASGVPARDVYGVRVAPSAFDYKQLGGTPEKLSGAQHCRAEVWLEDYGWVAMDPADVLKVMRQEREDWIKDRENPLIAPVDAALFGNWEGNWIAYNTASDVILPGSSAGPLPFLMYPQGENRAGRFDELAADTFSYKITAEEVGA
ncbi:transglutaminase-like domain-containing protein [Amaricoccus solimangrovi]|uniref:Transglutaminase domain-containing protein n=1 Tax=Amaricoccus solimangrovi TaxID=2589815 RepID=A0A501WD03_9RHOB|nr:transglutaminase domain-containing protein [Amaricoccus solimangrovi]TPE47469.1 transglutaminase domain-containing protein [Amaricoccus solimangrovi]